MSRPDIGFATIPTVEPGTTGRSLVTALTGQQSIPAGRPRRGLQRCCSRAAVRRRRAPAPPVPSTPPRTGSSRGRAARPPPPARAGRAGSAPPRRWPCAAGRPRRGPSTVLRVAVQRRLSAAAFIPGRPAPCSSRRISACRAVSGCARARSPTHPTAGRPVEVQRQPRSGSRPRPAAPASRSATGSGRHSPSPGTASGRVRLGHRDPGPRRDAGRCAPPSRGRRRAAPGRATGRSTGAADCAQPLEPLLVVPPQLGLGELHGRLRPARRSPGAAVIAGPLTSTMPSSSPVRGSWIGAAVQYQGCWVGSKCSAENSCTGAASASAVPIALVPTGALGPARALGEPQRVGPVPHPGRRPRATG